MKLLFDLNKDKFENFWKIQNIPAGVSAKIFDKPIEFGHDFYPTHAARGLLLELSFCPENCGPLHINLSPYHVCIDNDKHHSSISLSYVTNFISCTNKLRINPGVHNILKVEYSDGYLTIILNDEMYRYKCEYVPSLDSVKIGFSSGVKLYDLKLHAICESLFRQQTVEKFRYHMSVDFTSDIIPAPFTRKMLEHLMQKSKDIGVTRINWIYYGGKNSGFWDSIHLTEVEQNTWKTFENLSGDFLAAAVEAAHDAGLEIYAIIKPFDLAPHHANLPSDSELARKIGKADVLGGRMYWSDNFAASHPELCMQRRPNAAGVNKTVSAIIVESLEDIQNSDYDISLWTSNDNWKYRPYVGPLCVRNEERRFIIDNLKLDEPYFAITINEKNKKGQIYNTLDNLVKIFDNDGTELLFTYGLQPRQIRKYGNDGTHLSSFYDRGGGFAEEGFSFDYIPGIPTSVTFPQQPFNKYFGFDCNSEFTIAIARGQNDFVPSCLTPAEPAVCNYWMNLIRSAISKGADGIDIRAQNHCAVISWDEYGFNQPIIEEFQKRYGADVRTEKFDKRIWRRLCGEYFTKFLREARKELHKHSRKLQVHIEDLYEASPTFSPMNIHWDWQNWIEEGIPDEVTFKALHFESYKTEMARKMVAACKQKKIPIYYCPFLQAVTFQQKELWRPYLNEIKQAGIDAFVIYESATLFGARADGNIVDYNSDFCDILKSESGA